MRKKTVALWVAGGLAVMVAGYQLYAYATLPSLTSTQSASVGRSAAQVTNDCPGGATPLGHDWTPMQKEGCRVVYLVLPGGMVRIHTADNREYNARSPGLWNSDEIAGMRLVDGEAYWAHCPRHTIGYQVNWDCSRRS